MMPKIAIGADHAGFELKEKVREWLTRSGFEYKDYGTYSSESADYPDFAHPVASAVEDKQFDLGILICGSGNGVAITANKHQDIRAALCWTEDLASLARQHNDANILCLPSRYINSDLAMKIIDKFLNSSFEGGRHDRRVKKIAC
jgi:ribose 5-phosphate isomerase B